MALEALGIFIELCFIVHHTIFYLVIFVIAGYLRAELLKILSLSLLSLSTEGY